MTLSLASQTFPVFVIFPHVCLGSLINYLRKDNQIENLCLRGVNQSDINDLSQISLPAQENIECNMGSHPGVTRESRTNVDIQFDELKYSCPSGKVFRQVETILSHYIELGSIEPLPDDEGI